MDPALDAPPRFEPVPPYERCFDLWLAGQSYSAIGRRLGLDRETVSRHVRTLHAQAQAERRADRALALTRALAVVRRVQAAAWDEIERQQAREDDALRPPPTWAELDAPDAGRPAPYRAQVARLLGVILAAQKEEARLERLYDAGAPARAGDGDAKTNQDAWFLMLRRSDQEELKRLGYDPFDDPPPVPPDIPNIPPDPDLDVVADPSNHMADTLDRVDDPPDPVAGPPDIVSHPAADPDSPAVLAAGPAPSPAEPSALPETDAGVAPAPAARTVPPAPTGAPPLPSPAHGRGAGGEGHLAGPSDVDEPDDWYVHYAWPPGAVPSPDLLNRGPGATP